MMGIVVMLALGIETGTTALVAHAIGRGERRHAGMVTAQGIVVAAVLAVLLALVGVPFASAILRLLGGEPEVVTEGATYLRIVAGGGIGLLLQISLAAALRGAGDAVTPLKAMGAAIGLNVILDPVLIFGLAGFPALGVAGSAWATVISQLLATSVLFASLVFPYNKTLSVHLRQLRPRWDIIWRICRIGVYASGRAMIRNIGRFALMRLAAVFGTPAVAAFGIGMRLQMLILGPGKGFGMASAAMVGQNLGAGQPARATRSGWTAGGTGVSIGLGLALLFWLDPEFLIRVFNSDEEVVAAGVNLLHWFSASFPFLAVGIVLGDAMNGAGDSLRPMVITAIAHLLVGLPVAAVLALHWHWGEGVWIGLFTANVVVGVFSGVAFKRGRWRTAGLPQKERLAAEKKALEDT